MCDPAFLIDLVRHAGVEPCLVRIGSTARGTEGLYVWSSGDIGALVSPEGARIKRDTGHIGSRDGVLIPWEAFPALAGILQRWNQVRHQWAAFTESGGFARMYGAKAWYFHPPGKNSKKVEVGRTNPAARRPCPLSRSEQVIEPTSQPSLPRGCTLRTEIYRVEQEWTGEDGLKVGEILDLPDGFEVEARRFDVKLTRSGRKVWLVSGEHEFIAALAELADTVSE